MAEPLEKWRIFLHPTQRKIVNRDFSGPARVLGGAGTGKTVVAMHRAKRLAVELTKGKQVLFTTYTKNLAGDIRENLRKIVSVDQMRKMEVINLDAWVSSFLRDQGYEYTVSYGDELDKIWDDAIAQAGGALDYTKNFYVDEWIKVVQVQEAYTKEKYIKAPRIGRSLRLDRMKRMKVWGVFEEYMHLCDDRKLRDSEFSMYECRIILEKQFSSGKFENIIVDEGQDLSPSAYRLIELISIPVEDVDRNAKYLRIIPEQFIDVYLEKEEYGILWKTRQIISRFELGKCRFPNLIAYIPTMEMII